MRTALGVLMVVMTHGAAAPSLEAQAARSVAAVRADPAVATALDHARRNESQTFDRSKSGRAGRP
jgi:hypothetical protein